MAEDQEFIWLYYLGRKKNPLIYDLKREKMVALFSTDTKFEFVFQTPIWGLDCTD